MAGIQIFNFKNIYICSLNYLKLVFPHSQSTVGPPELSQQVGGHRYTVRKVINFPVPSLDVTDQTLPGQEKLNYSRPGRVWSVTSRLGTGKPLTFFLQCKELKF
jgi:hypothetical protein